MTARNIVRPQVTVNWETGDMHLIGLGNRKPIPLDEDAALELASTIINSLRGAQRARARATRPEGA